MSFRTYENWTDNAEHRYAAHTAAASGIRPHGEPDCEFRAFRAARWLCAVWPCTVAVAHAPYPSTDTQKAIHREGRACGMPEMYLRGVRRRLIDTRHLEKICVM